jgi:hypothetical protein
MFATTSFATAKVLLQPVQPLIALPPAKPKKKAEETRLWKLSAVSRRERAILELFALILFLSLALLGCWSCFAELSQLLDNDALGWFARKALAR